MTRGANKRHAKARPAVGAPGEKLQIYVSEGTGLATEARHEDELEGYRALLAQLFRIRRAVSQTGDLGCLR